MLFVDCLSIGRYSFFPIVLSWCAIIFVSSSNMLLESGSRPTHCRKQYTYYRSSVFSASERLLSLLGVADWTGFGMPFGLGSVHIYWVVPDSFLEGGGGVVPASSAVGAGGVVPSPFPDGAGAIVPVTVTLGPGGIVLASSLVELLVSTSYPHLARSKNSPSTLHPSVFLPFPLVDVIGVGTIWRVLGNIGGPGIQWLAGGIPKLPGRVPWLAGSVPWWTGGMPWSTSSIL